MPRDVQPEFIQTKNAQTNQPIMLYTLFDYDGAGNDLHYAQYDDDVVFDGVTYSSMPISFDGIGSNSKGEIDKVKVKIANVSRAIGAYLEVYDFRGKKVSLKTVWADQLADTDNYIEDIFYIDSYFVNAQDAEFELTGKFDVMTINLPLRRYMRNYCGWKFKSTECGYSGSETSCSKTKARCKELSNYQRFGAFPSIRPTKVFLG